MENRRLAGQYWFVACWLVAAACSKPAHQMSEVGDVSFPNSGPAEAQESFQRGMALLHNFEYRSAIEAFQEAQSTDPDFAMAYWGEAMAHNYPIWMRQNREAALEVLGRLGATADERLSKAPTELEKDWLRVLEVLYGEGDKRERDQAYAKAMAELHDKYPEDVGVTAFHALSLLGTAHEGRDFAIYMRSAALLEEIYPDNPRHPGVLHYLIHSYDDPIHAPLGLRAARTYAEVAPAAAHAQHMTSHIFVAMGMWDEVVKANENATRVTNEELAARGQSEYYCGHYNFWLLYGYLQQGRLDDATEILHRCRGNAADAGAEETVFDPDTSTLHSFLQLRSRYLVDTGDWSGEAVQWEIDLSTAGAAERATYESAQAIAAAGRDDKKGIEKALLGLSAARSELEQMVPQTDNAFAPLALKRAQVFELEIGATLARVEGRTDEAIELARQAVELEESIPLMFGPPFVDLPSHELLGELLLAAGRPSEAYDAYAAALARTPGRVSVLEGLAAAQKRIDEEED